MNISTNCTIAAITDINTISFKNPRSVSIKSSLIQTSAPLAKRYSQRTQLIGAVIVNTTTTANPIPTDASILYDIARNEHNPKKYAKTIFSIKTALVNMLR